MGMAWTTQHFQWRFSIERRIQSGNKLLILVQGTAPKCLTISQKVLNGTKYGSFMASSFKEYKIRAL